MDREWWPKAAQPLLGSCAFGPHCQSMCLDVVKCCAVLVLSLSTDAHRSALTGAIAQEH